MPRANLAIFDLDHTLLEGDCSQLWGEHMQRLGWVEPVAFAQAHQALMADYQERGLDMQAYLALTLAPLQGRCVREVQMEVGLFVQEHIVPRLYRDTWDLLAEHRMAGDQLLLISASEDFLVAPIGRALGFSPSNTFGVPCEQRDGCFTGQGAGEPTYGVGKVHCLERWLAQQPFSVADSTFYSDSHNDLPLLEWVSQPVATNPNPQLAALASARHWPQRWLDQPLPRRRAAAE
ncbi:HAD family hydrolase [Atopomonas sediminilitoris]|uniref:HAD family hydrolase n=1 Tax=Atopomonas sediminilitoris TaxID=2919919 RepID=UPI001F4D9F78|nr:HAD family hydrolase [Atopomonas sediminilitoris]MCJ8170525.1 HAD-IB family hydrolase [Atopomonas sediminilitoris]